MSTATDATDIRGGPCLFCRIGQGTAHAHVVHGGERLLAFLALCPIRPDHTLIVPKAHFAYFDDLPSDVAAPILALGQKLALAMKQLYRVERVAFAFTGGDIDHAHAHVFPIVEKTDITSRRYIVERQVTFHERPRMHDNDLAENQAKLAQALATVS